MNQAQSPELDPPGKEPGKWMNITTGSSGGTASRDSQGNFHARKGKAGRLLVGIDLGTSSVKAIIMDANGRLLAQTAQEFEISTPRTGWAEQNPEGWVQATCLTVRQALAQADLTPDQVAAIGLSGQMHGTVCLDRHGRPLRPAIIWADQRSGRQVEQVYQQVGKQQLGRWTANPLDTGFMLATWLWLREHEPETARATAHLLLPKDYLRFWLTGSLGCEPSDACSTLLFDTVQRCWSRGLLEALAIPPTLLPPVQPSSAIAGGLTREAAIATGLLAGTPVAFGGGDQPCQALGNGVVEPGLVSCTIGTGGQLFAPSATPSYDPQLRLHLFCHVVPDRWYLMAAILAAGLSLRWLRDNILTGHTYQELADLATSAPAGAEGLFFLPHLAGERTPHMDSTARGSFIGLTLRHDRRHLARAVMEGVVFALRQGLELMLDLKVPVERIVASGGAIRHPLWLQLLADIFNRPIYRTLTTEAAAVGAALLAGIGVGVFADVQAACRQAVRWHEEAIQPDPAKAAIYERAFAVYRRLYPALVAAGAHGEAA